MDQERGWHRLVEFMVSGEPGSFVLWGLMIWAAWATVVGKDDSGGDGGWWGDGDGDCGD